VADRTDIGIVPLSLLILLGGYLFLDGVFVFLSMAQLGLYALFAIATAGAAALVLTSSQLKLREVAIILVWLLMAGLWLLPPLFADYPYPRYVVSDFIAILLPVVLLTVGLRYESLFLSRNSLVVLGVLMFMAALLAVPLAESAGRHEPPHTLLTAMAWAVFFLSRSAPMRRAAIIALGVLLLLAWTSGERTAVLLLLALGLGGRVLLMQRLRNAVFLVTGLLLVLAAVSVIFGDVLILAAASTRLETLAQGELDESLLNRILEVRDVWKQWSLEQWFGMGHGATFTPELSYPPRNLTEHGRVHHIHFGPILLLYRYGVPGLLLYLWLTVDVLHYITAMNRVRFQTPHGIVSFFFALALVGYLASFLVFTIIPDPAFSYALAGYLFMRLTQPVPRLCEIRLDHRSSAMSHAL
jgi:hypothetical protein